MTGTVMKLAAALPVVLLVASCSGASTPAPTIADAPALTNFDCHMGNVAVNFWPDGHPAIPSINAPELWLPHVEVVGATGGGATGVQFYFDINGVLRQEQGACDESPVPLHDGTVQGGSEIDQGGHLFCPETEGLVVRSGPGNEPATVTVTAAGTIVAHLILAAGGSTLSYVDGSCTLSPPPS